MTGKCKLPAMLALFFLLASLLVGCAVEVKPSENKPSASDYLQQIDLSIVGVGCGHSSSGGDEALIRQFEKNSGARVIVKRTAAGQNAASYQEYLDLLVNSDGLPDLIIFPSFTDTYQKQFLYRLNEFIKDDPSIEELPGLLKATAADADSVYALPLRWEMEGYFARSDDFTKQNLPVPAFGLSFTRFFSAAKVLAEAGLISVEALYPIPYWYPAAQGDGFAWCGYREQSFHFTDKVFLAGVSYAGQLQAACPGKLVGTPALRYDSTRNLTALKQAGYDVYLGIPGGKAIIDADYIGITRQSAHKKEAFALAKWLSYDPTSVQIRISDSTNAAEGSFPATGSVKLLARLPWYSFAGIPEAADAIEQAIMRGEDHIPSYRAMTEKKFLLSYDKERVFSLKEVLNYAVDGELSFAKYAAELEEALS